MRFLPFDYSIRNLGRSPVRLALSVTGSLLVVLLVLSAGAFVRGMDKSLRVSGQADNVMLLGAGSEESVERSEIGPSVAGLVQASVPGIRQRLGVAYVSPEVFMMALLKLDHADEQSHQLMLRGVTPAAFLVHSQARITDGRAPEAGKDEILVGSLVATKMGVPDARLAVGQTIQFDERTWTIAGRFEAPGTVMEAEIWTPLSDLQIAARRDNVSCVVVTMDSQEGFDDVDTFARQRLDLELVAMRETDYFRKLSAFFRPIQFMVWTTAILIATGGLLGGLNTMYAAFASRIREIGSLQAIGFPRYAIVASLVQESVLATAAGALLAAGAGLLLLDGLTVRFSMGVFGLVIDSSVLLLALTAGLLLGVIGALPPAYRCLRLPIAEALKAY
ncbi:MAG: putative transport system permease protein [Phycisphaerales bacterium]|nr:putative transport system permease protein [Phycisphaerales bacterium]